MAAAAREERWQRLASLLALLANCHRDPRRQRAFTAEDFLPRAPDPTPRPQADLALLKTIFVDRAAEIRP